MSAFSSVILRFSNDAVAVYFKIAWCLHASFVVFTVVVYSFAVCKLKILRNLQNASKVHSGHEFRLFLFSGVICILQIALACLFALRFQLANQFYFLFNLVKYVLQSMRCVRVHTLHEV